MKNLMIVLICLLVSTQTYALTRTALVIGNSDYKLMPLGNPEKDAHDIAKKLKTLDFEVVSKVNQNQKEMVELIREFARKLKRKGGVGLFFYAGHGMQIDGSNYLVPVDFAAQEAYEVAGASINANLITGAMEEAGNPLNIIVLDACRDNPFPRKNRSGSRGLARMDSASGTIIAYSTGPGDVAADGDGRNSPYAAHLLQNMDSPGLTIEQVFKKVRVGVEDSTGGRQLPWETSSLRGDFYFNPDQNQGARTTAFIQQPPSELFTSFSPKPTIANIPQPEFGSTSAQAKKLSIFTNPENSTVKLLNSNISYAPGVKLDPGDYRIQISKEGFITKSQWINVDKDNLELQITLVPEN